jgi:S1-C subfamily serine protease
VAAFIISLLGIPLFGLITGLVAIVFACVALVGHTHGRRGFALAVLAMFIGLFDVIGWAVGLSHYLGVVPSMVSLDELTLDPESLKELPAKFSRAMRANVVIESVAGLGRGAIGSGVVLKVDQGVAHIVTNRHTVDMNYTTSTRTAPADLAELARVRVTAVGQRPVPASVEWVAPHGVDLAIISAPIQAADVEAAHWNLDAQPHIGDEVFAVGNPHGLGWTHSAGDISQIRRRSQGDYSFRILQTTAAINPGNSGGGLYDSEGRLIGINTLTGDKRFAEGLGFSISLSTLLELLPDRFGLSQKNPPEAVLEETDEVGEKQ